MTRPVQVILTESAPGALADRAAGALGASAGLSPAAADEAITSVLDGGVACIPHTAEDGAKALIRELADYGFGARLLPFGGPTSPDLLPPGPLAAEPPEPAAAAALLAGWGHVAPDRWLEAKGPFASGTAFWRELLRDECDKLYNQAWCAFDQIRSADDPDSVMFLAMDDFPSAVEQAFALAPPLASEHLLLLREYREERLDAFLRELAAGTDREPKERAEALAFWEENAEGISDLRRNLFRLVRGALQP